MQAQRMPDAQAAGEKSAVFSDNKNACPTGNRIEKHFFTPF
jgi:hypothetical protein